MRRRLDAPRLVEAGHDPICTFRDPARNACIDLPMEREKFGGARAFRDIWLHESSIRYSPIRDQERSWCCTTSETSTPE